MRNVVIFLCNREQKLDIDLNFGILVNIGGDVRETVAGSDQTVKLRYVWKNDAKKWLASKIYPCE